MRLYIIFKEKQKLSEMKLCLEQIFGKVEVLNITGVGKGKMYHLSVKLDGEDKTINYVKNDRYYTDDNKIIKGSTLFSEDLSDGMLTAFTKIAMKYNCRLRIIGEKPNEVLIDNEIIKKI